MFPVAPIISVIIFVFTFHICSVLVVRSFYFIIFLASFLITYLSPEIAASIDMLFFFSITYHDVQFILMDGSVGLHLLIP